MNIKEGGAVGNFSLEVVGDWVKTSGTYGLQALKHQTFTQNCTVWKAAIETGWNIKDLCQNQIKSDFMYFKKRSKNKMKLIDFL